MDDWGNSSALLLSLRPQFASLVFCGEKKTELRRRFGRDVSGGHALVYVTSPVRQLRGGFRVESVVSGTLDEVWDKVSASAGINRAQFDAYYDGSSVAYALKIVDVWEYVEPVDLSELRSRFGRFVVPQSWRYVNPDEYRSLSVWEQVHPNV